MPALRDPIFPPFRGVHILQHNGTLWSHCWPSLWKSLQIEEDSGKIKNTPEPRIRQFVLINGYPAASPLAEDRGFILHTPPSRFASSISTSRTAVITTSRDVRWKRWVPSNGLPILLWSR